MRALIADTYVVLWKQFYSQRSSQNVDFWAAGICGFCVLLWLANVAQFIALIMKIDIPVLHMSSKGEKLLIGAGVLLACVGGMKLFVRCCSDLQTQEGIEQRYTQMTQKRRITIVVGMFASLGVAFIIHYLRVSNNSYQ